MAETGVVLALSLSRSLSVLFLVEIEIWPNDACVDTKVSTFTPVRGLWPVYRYRCTSEVLRPDGPLVCGAGLSLLFSRFLFCTSAISREGGYCNANGMLQKPVHTG